MVKTSGMDEVSSTHHLSLAGNDKTIVTAFFLHVSCPFPAFVPPLLLPTLHVSPLLTEVSPQLPLPLLQGTSLRP